MMRRLCLTLLALLPAVAGAQQQSPPDNPDGAQIPFEFRVGGYYLSGERNVWFNGALSQATGNLQGGEGLFWPPSSIIAFAGQYTQGQFGSQPQLVAAEGRVLLGVPQFALTGGFARRALASDVGTILYSYIPVGAQSTFHIGGSGLRGTLSGMYYVPMGGSDTTAGTGSVKQGIEGEAAVIWNVLSVFYVEAGYRTEVFTAKRGVNGETPEEVRGLRLGGGFQFGGK